MKTHSNDEINIVGGYSIASVSAYIFYLFIFVFYRKWSYGNRKKKKNNNKSTRPANIKSQTRTFLYGQTRDYFCIFLYFVIFFRKVFFRLHIFWSFWKSYGHDRGGVDDLNHKDWDRRACTPPQIILQIHTCVKKVDFIFSKNSTFLKL